MKKTPQIPKSKRTPFNKEAFLKAAEQVQKIFEKEEKRKAADGNA